MRGRRASERRRPNDRDRALLQRHYGRFFTPGDAEDLARVVRDLCESPDEIERLARAAGAFRRVHNWRDAGHAYVELVRGLATNAR
jgi:hypothetical protein